MSKDVYIKKTIEELKLRENKLACELLETKNCIATLKQVFGLEEQEQNQAVAQSTVPPEPKPVPKKPSTQRKKKTTSTTSLQKGTTNRFKGVREDKRGYVDGRKKYVVNYYDPDKGKKIYLGSFDNEYLAAAKYQERAGNKAEAAKLRAQASQQQADMTEQVENNPDRPPAKKRGKGKMIYVCKRCGLKWKSRPRPILGCPGCGNDDFHEVPGGGD